MTLVEIQLIDGCPDSVSETLKALSQPIALSKLFALGDQCLSLFLDGTRPQFQFLAATQKLVRCDEICLIEISHAATFGDDRIELAVCSSNLGVEQVITCRLASARQGCFAREKHVRA